MDLEQCRSQIWNDPFVSTWDPWQFKSKIPDNLSLPFKKVCLPPHSTHERQSRRSHLHSWTHTVLHLLKIVYVTLFFNFQNCLCDTYFQLQWTPSSWTPSPSDSWLGTKMCELIVKMCVFVIAMLLCKYCWQKDSSDPDFSCGRDERTNGRTDERTNRR